MAKATKRDTEAVVKCRDVVEGLMGEFLQVTFPVMLSAAALRWLRSKFLACCTKAAMPCRCAAMPGTQHACVLFCSGGLLLCSLT